MPKSQLIYVSKMAPVVSNEQLISGWKNNNVEIGLIIDKEVNNIFRINLRPARYHPISTFIHSRIQDMLCLLHEESVIHDPDGTPNKFC